MVFINFQKSFTMMHRKSRFDCINFNFHNVFVSLVLAFISSSSHAQSLEQAVQMALTQYPAILAAQSRTAQAEADIGRARGQHWPQVGWTGTQSNYTSSGGTPFSPNNTWIQSPSVSVNVWSGWRIESEVERAQALTQAGKSQQRITRDEVALLATEGYQNWARTLEQVKLAKDNLHAHQRILGDIKKIVAVDSGRQIDLEQALVRQENAALILRQRESENAIARERLNRMLLGQVPAAPSGLDYVYKGLPVSSAAALTMIDDYHPVIAQQRAIVQSAQANVRNARSQHSPVVNMTYGKQATQGTGQGDYVAQLTVSMPIFSGGSATGAVNAANAQMQAEEYALKEIRLTQRERLITAWSEWESAASRKKLGQQQVSSGKNLVQGYELQFKVGKRSLLDLLNIQNDYYTYQSNAINARFEERIAQAKILAALGRLALSYQGTAGTP
jgi:outer membrane protein, adhesin transport system